jgi:hypothetical protein
LLFVWIIGLAAGAVHPLGFLFAIASTCIYLLFAAILGTYVSLRMKSSARAIAITVTSLVFLNGGYLFCCATAMRGEPDSIVIAAGVTPAVVAVAPFSYEEFGDFRRGIGFNTRYGPTRPGIVFTGLLSLFLYGGGALALLHACMARFAIEADRPRRGFRKLDQSGIHYIQQDTHILEDDYIIFEEADEADERCEQATEHGTEPSSHPETAP